jgi:hypothetical protein
MSGLHSLPPSQERQKLASEFWNFLADITVHAISNPDLFKSCAQVMKQGTAIYELLAAPTLHSATSSKPFSAHTRVPPP